MPRLTVDLREGFSSDTVVLRVNGAEVHRTGGVTTDYSVGLAESMTAEIDGPAEVEVSLPDRSVSGAVDVPADQDTWLGVRVAGGALEFRVSAKPFVYY